MLLSLLATLIMLTAFLSPSWLVAAPEKVVFDNETVLYRPSVGVYAKCNRPINFNYPVCTLLAVKGLATDSHIFPTLWKASVVFLTFGKSYHSDVTELVVVIRYENCKISGLSIMSVTVCLGIISCCFQSIFKKSIFNISGAVQVLAGK